MSVIRAEGVTKRFGGVAVLQDVDLALDAGTLTGLVGENGAGKSTLIKILTGLIQRDSGRLLVEEQPVDAWPPTRAREAGVAVIHQELLLVPELSVADNVMLGETLRRPGWAGRVAGMRDDRANQRRAEELLGELGIDLDVRVRVRDISPSHAQMVLIARSLRTQGSVLILDEPTASLAPGERVELYALLRGLLARGTAILLVSHHLQEVKELSSRVTVLRNGRVVAELAGDDLTVPRMVEGMLDRSLEDQFPPVSHQPTDQIALKAVGMRSAPTLKDASLSVRRGEILGITGLLGAGKTEFARAVVGLDAARGDIELDGRRRRPRGPRAGVRDGVLLVPEERKEQAILPELSVYRNGVLSVLAKGVRALGLTALLPGSRPVHDVFKEKVGALGVRYASPEQPAGRLSGGNQQKLVIGRALACDPNVLILDEPTRGVDVGSKREIYRIVVEQAEAGLGVILISSDTREVLALAHRVLVLRDGVVAAEVDPSETSNEELTMLLSPAETARHRTPSQG